jgi:uncharacterized integral membrane protein
MRIVLTVALTILFILFGLENMQVVSVNFSPLGIETNTYMVVLIFICFFAGIFVGVSSALYVFIHKYRRNKAQIRQLELERAAMQQQLLAIQAESIATNQLRSIN